MVGLVADPFGDLGDAGAADPDVTALASLYVPHAFDGEAGETPGITQKRHGNGRVVALAFDLPRCVMLLRQGDPALADRQLAYDCPLRRCCKPTNLAADIGPFDAGDIPFADLLGRVLVDLILDALPMPMPTLATLPAGSAGVLLFSGDEDHAPLDVTRQEMEEVSGAGGRMNLYIIPGATDSTRDDADRYAQSHDLGPHPDITPLCDEPIPARVESYERQINQFREMYGIAPRSVRNHAAGWAGYLDLVHVQQRCGIRMDANYFSGHVFRERQHSVFSPFGGALPMRFVEPGGQLIDVFQQHTQLHDDVWFAPDRPYSYKFSLDTARPLLSRLLDEAVNRFGVPVATNFHPGNWHFAGDHARAMLQLAREKGMAIWSLDRWLAFWEARDRCRLGQPVWNGARLRFEVVTDSEREDLCMELPLQWHSHRLSDLYCDSDRLAWITLARAEGSVACFRLPPRRAALAIDAHYKGL